MRPLSCLLIVGAGILSLFVPASAFAQAKAKCGPIKVCRGNPAMACNANADCGANGPCDVVPIGLSCGNPQPKGAFPKPQCEVWSHNDPKRGGWKHFCTNEAAGGNWAWTYDEDKRDPGKGIKKIGKCDRDQGRNCEWILGEKDDPTQWRVFVQVVYSTKHKKCQGGPHNGELCGDATDCQGNPCGGDKVPFLQRRTGNERTVRVFAPKAIKLCQGGANAGRPCGADGDCPGSTCKEVAKNSGFEFKERFDKKNPGSGWREIPNTRRGYESLALNYQDGSPPTVEQEAEYAVRVAMVATGAGPNAVNVGWSVFEGAHPPLPNPVLVPGDQVYLDALSVGDILHHDPRFALSASPPGVKLVPTQPVSLGTGDVLATIRQPHADLLYYAVLVEGADEFFNAVFNGAPVELDFEQVPGYAATAGNMDLSALQIVVDGVRDVGCALDAAKQTTQTQFGDSNLGMVDFANGSELDVACVTIQENTLHLFLGGNLEANFNKLEIFFDGLSGGQNRLRGDNPDVDFDGLNRMAGLRFDDGFEADYWLGVTGGNTGSGYQLFANFAELLTGGGGNGYYLGQGLAGSDGTLVGGTNPFGIRVTLDNSNVDGVDGGCGSANADSVQSGIEVAVPLAALGNPTSCIKIATFINGGGHDFVSNQVLAPLPPGTCNLGEPRFVDFQSIPGTQHFTVCFSPVAVDPIVPEAGPRIVAWPNPFSAEVNLRIEAPAGRVTQAEVFDLAGRRVKSFPSTAFGSGRVVWNGRGDDGQPLPAGVYLVRVRTGLTEQSALLLRMP